MSYGIMLTGAVLIIISIWFFLMMVEAKDNSKSRKCVYHVKKLLKRK